MTSGPGTSVPSIWWRPALWWRIGIVLAGAYGLTFATSSLVYFTVQVNVIVVGDFARASYWMARDGEAVTPAPRLRGAVTYWILITGLVAHVLLNDGANPLPALVEAHDLHREWATFAVHYVVPLMVLADWLAFVPRRQVPWRILPLWLAYPLLYALIAEARAAVYPGFGTPYPYYFLDPRVRGYEWVGGQFLLLTVEFAVLGAILVLVDRLPGREQAQGDHADAEEQVQPVVRGVDRDEVGGALVADHQTVQPEHEVDGPAADQVGAGARRRAGHRDAGGTEEQVHDVVQDRNLEDPEQFRVRVVAGEGHRAVIRGESGNESQHTDEQEDDPDSERRCADQRPARRRRGM